jgi:hypothetical protein
MAWSLCLIRRLTVIIPPRFLPTIPFMGQSPTELIPASVRVVTSAVSARADLLKELGEP